MIFGVIFNKHVIGISVSSRSSWIGKRFNTYPNMGVDSDNKGEICH